MSVRVDFVENAKGWRRSLPARTLARQAIGAAAEESGIVLRRGAEVCVHLVNDAEIRVLNAKWRGKDMPTNVLAFPAAAPTRVEDARLLGDVLIAFETVSREAEQEHKPLADHFRHLVVHGFLHLLGFDHLDDEQAETMEALETRVLAKLGVADPHASRELAGADS